MFFNTLLTIAILTCVSPKQEMKEDENIKYFKNLDSIAYQDTAILQNKYKYSKIPTKIIKTNKKSN